MDWDKKHKHAEAIVARFNKKFPTTKTKHHGYQEGPKVFVFVINDYFA